MKDISHLQKEMQKLLAEKIQSQKGLSIIFQINNIIGKKHGNFQNMLLPALNMMVRNISRKILKKPDGFKNIFLKLMIRNGAQLMFFIRNNFLKRMKVHFYLKKGISLKT